MRELTEAEAYDAMHKITGLPKVEYKTIDLTTVAGFDEVDRLMEDGWQVNRNGMFSVQLYRAVE